MQEVNGIKYESIPSLSTRADWTLFRTNYHITELQERIYRTYFEEYFSAKRGNELLIPEVVTVANAPEIRFQNMLFMLEYDQLFSSGKQLAISADGRIIKFSYSGMINSLNEVFYAESLLDVTRLYDVKNLAADSSLPRIQNQEYGFAIKQMRQEKEITPAQLANILMITPLELGMVEMQDMTLSNIQLNMIANVLDISAEKLKKGTIAPAPDVGAMLEENLYMRTDIKLFKDKIFDILSQLQNIFPSQLKVIGAEETSRIIYQIYDTQSGEWVLNQDTGKRMEFENPAEALKMAKELEKTSSFVTKGMEKQNEKTEPDNAAVSQKVISEEALNEVKEERRNVKSNVLPEIKAPKI